MKASTRWNGLHKKGMHRKSFLLVETIPFSESHFFQWKSFFLPEAIPFSRRHSFQWKPFLLVETISYRGNHCPQWRTFLLVEAISFSRCCFFFQWKLLSFVSVEAISFRGNHSPLVEAIPLFTNCDWLIFKHHAINKSNSFHQKELPQKRMHSGRKFLMIINQDL